MSSQPAAMAEAVTAAATPLLIGLPDEIVTWEILVRLDPKSLLRCRAVRRAWRRVTSTRRFLPAHHAHQPALHVLAGNQLALGVHCLDILAFDHRAIVSAQLHTVAPLDGDFYLEASCDDLLILSNICRASSGSCISICNPATREHASLPEPPWDFAVLGMYLHRPTGEYRLLLQRHDMGTSEEQIGWYVFSLGSDEPPRYIGWPGTELEVFNLPVQLRDSLHWYPLYHHMSESNQSESKPIIVFDTIAESFRHMHAPIVPTKSYIFEMDDTVAIYCHDDGNNTVGTWVLRNYESETWDLKYIIRLPVEEISGRFEGCDDSQDVKLWNVNVVSGHGGVLLLVSFGQCVLHIDTDGKLIDSFHRGLLDLHICECWLKQSLVQHTFFPALEGYVVNASPFL